jgi:putative acetyltransferase
MAVQEDFLIRPERIEDIAAVREVHERAFGRMAEATLVDALRQAGALTLAMVAEAGGAVVGHAAFSPVTTDGRPALRAVGLAPLGVLPPWQRRGVGKHMVWKGIETLREMGYDAVVAIGHPRLYPELHFAPASRWGLRWEHPCPEGAFRVWELRDGALGPPGQPEAIVRYHPEFDAV